MLNHVAIPVQNLAESKAFYELLNFKVSTTWEKPAQELKAIVMEHSSGYRLELIEHPKNHEISFPNVLEVLHIGLEVEDLEKTVANLISQGIAPITPIIQGVSVKRFAFFKDPNGFSVELVEAKQEVF
jgi:catechol 2,3-dioxygenase-like lactoylglutathione lyase family enzyme